MEVSQEQARDLLKDLDQVARDASAKVAHGIVGPFLIIWGAVWVVCFTMEYFSPRYAGWAWLVGNILGWVGTLYWTWVGIGRGPVQSVASRALTWRLFAFVLAVLVYAFLWLAILKPVPGVRIGVFFVTLWMFAFVVMGLWMEMRFMVVLGLAITLAAAAGYFGPFVPLRYIDLWLAMTGGMGLLGSGIYLVYRWR